jgi:hypothetical protein
MPFMQRLTWSGIALHAGELPGYPASHGCIRLPDDFAVRLWGTTQIATRVIITHGEVKPLPFAHPRLFTPKPAKPKVDPTDVPMAMQPAPDDRVDFATLQPLARQGQISIASAPITPKSLDRVAALEGLNFLAGLRNNLTMVNADGTPVADVAEATDDDEDDAPAASTGPGPITIVRGGRPTEVVEVAEAPQITEEGVARITVMRGSRLSEIEVIAVNKVPAPATQLALPFEPEPPVAVAHNGVIVPLGARRPVQIEKRLSPPALQPAPRPEPRVTLAPPEDDVTGPANDVRREPPPLAAPAIATPAFATPAVATPANAAPAVVTPAAATPAAAADQPEEAEPVQEARAGTSRRRQQVQEMPVNPPAPQARPLRPGPLTVFVSRKERRMFVRKGFEPLFDVPVTIASPERTLGNHVFTAMAIGETDARWTVVSMPVERVRLSPSGEDAYGQRRKRRQAGFISAPSPVSPHEALDRIEMPADAVTRISELLSVGATLIVSDEGLGRETGRETDFTVVLTK